MCPASHDAAAGVMADWMYEQLTEKYVLDPENRKFINESNLPALHRCRSGCSRLCHTSSTWKGQHSNGTDRSA
jgi:cobalamin biosynthesis Mg chelatase CobN